MYWRFQLKTVDKQIEQFANISQESKITKDNLIVILSHTHKNLSFLFIVYLYFLFVFHIFALIHFLIYTLTTCTLNFMLMQYFSIDQIHFSWYNLPGRNNLYLGNQAQYQKHKSLFFVHSPINPAFQESQCILRYKQEGLASAPLHADVNTWILSLL